MDKKNVRYNIVVVLIYIIGIALLVQLFNLQIVHGDEYLETSSTRLTRETTIVAARGNILDRNGNIIAGTTTRYSLEIYKSKIDNETLNNTILSIINVLESNGDKYKDSFPISVNPIEFTKSDETIKKWLEENNLDENLTAAEALYKFKDKYSINNENIEEIRKIISVRYGIQINGYSAMSSYIISSDISKESVAIFEEQKLNYPGISIEQKAVREYEYGSLSSHILGYIGKINSTELENNEGYSMNDYIGKTGIEYVYEKFLKGKNGTKQTDMSVDGTITGEYVTAEAEQGNDVVLTIDANLQNKTEEALKNTIEKIKNGGFGKAYEAKGGAAVVLDVKTGEVLALASYPDYEPELFIDGISEEKWSEYNNEKNNSLLNRAVQSAYAPGSTFKMVTATAGLETGGVTANELIVDTGIYHAGGGYNPRCWYYNEYGTGHGALNVSDAIKNSCNYYFYEVASRIGIENIEKYARYFGLGDKTNIELIGELSGTLAGKTLYKKLGQTWYDGIALSAAIGQAENNFTPIQMARYIAMLANGGNKIDVTLIKDIVNAQDNTSCVTKEEIKNYTYEKLNLSDTETEDLNIKEETISAVLEGMKSVTTETGGTAYSIFKDFPIEVGGKTGSAETWNDEVNAWFVGFAPYDEPEIAVVVLIENGWHGSYTAEVVRDVMAEYFKVNEEIKEDKTAIPYTEQNND